MSSGLTWNVTKRAQSAFSAPSGRQFEAALPPLPTETPEDLWNVGFSSEEDDANRHNHRPQSCPPQRVAIQRAQNEPKNSTNLPPHPPLRFPKYWELGSLGPAHVATPEWKERRERYLKQKAFGKAVLVANRQAHNRKFQYIEQDMHTPPEARRSEKLKEIQNENNIGIEVDEEVAEIAARAERKDVATAMALLSV